MSDLTGSLRRAIAARLRADPGVQATFTDGAPRIVGVPETNQKPPYITMGPALVDPVLAEGFDLSEIDYPVHVWSLTSPAGPAEAEEIAGAIRQALVAPLELDTGRALVAIPGRTTYLIDPSDGRTIHAVVSTRFTTNR